MDDTDLTGRQKAGIFVYVIACALCADEMVPAWRRLDLGLTQAQFYGVMGVSGAVGGALMAGRPLLGLIPGAVAGLGSLSVNVYQLTGVSSIHTAVLALGAGAGALPGVALYFLLDWLVPGSSPKRPVPDKPRPPEP